MGVHELPNAGSSGDGAADVWEAIEQLDVVKECIAESFRARGEIKPGIFEDVPEVG